MFKRLLTICAVLLVVSACSSKPKNDDASLSTDGEAGRNGYGVAVSGLDGEELNGAAPGTQQDLVANVGDRVFFGYNEYNLTTEAKELIESQSAWLKKYPELGMIIEGHCDERGTREYNLALGEKRAVAVRNYLVALGVEANRLETISYGKERPAVTGSDEESWAQNRRSVIVVK